MEHRFSRTELLIGKAGLAKLQKACVAVFGIGGVGSFAVEALARAGIGRLVLVDYDDVCVTNVNRQIHALEHTIGQPKVAVMAERVKAINPAVIVTPVRAVYDAGKPELVQGEYDYIVDAIDTMVAKVALIKTALAANIPIVSSMGAGNKLDPTQFRVTDISKTHTCPMAKAVRQHLREAGITRGLTVVFSPEPPRTPAPLDRVFPECGGVQSNTIRRHVPGSISFVTATAGLFLAGVVVNKLLEEAM